MLFSDEINSPKFGCPAVATGTVCGAVCGAVVADDAAGFGAVCGWVCAKARPLEPMTAAAKSTEANFCIPMHLQLECRRFCPAPGRLNDPARLSIPIDPTSGDRSLDSLSSG